MLSPSRRYICERRVAFQQADGLFLARPTLLSVIPVGLENRLLSRNPKVLFQWEKKKKKHYYGRKFPICRRARFQSSFPQYRDRQRPMKGDCFFLCMQLKDLMPDWFPIIQFTLNNLEWTGRDIGIVFVDLFVSLPASMLSLSILRPKRSSRNSFWTSRGRAVDVLYNCPGSVQSILSGWRGTCCVPLLWKEVLRHLCQKPTRLQYLCLS